jgi:hypothetical protein
MGNYPLLYGSLHSEEAFMKATMLLALTSVVLAGGCTRAAGDEESSRSTDITSGSQPIFIAAAELDWFDLDPENAPGVQLATLWGDPASGAFGASMRLPAGFASPLHTHTHAMKVVFVSGTYLQEPEGGAVARLGPGSFMMQPGGDYRHVTTCGPEADCVFFVESAGTFDMFVVDGAPGGA